MTKVRTAFAMTLLTVASVALGQTSANTTSKDGTKPRPDPQPFYTPYTGPGFGNPDAAKQGEPLGASRKKYNDGPGTSAYSRGGNTDITPINPPKTGKPKNGKKDKPKSENAEAAPASPPAPPANEKR